LDGHHANALALSDEDGIHAGPGGAPMNSVLIGLAGLVAAMSPGPDVPAGEAQVPPPGLLQDAACEIRPDAPYINPRLPLGRAAYAQRPACHTTWAPGPGGPGLYVQGPPIRGDAPPVIVGGLRIYLVPPEVIVRPSSVTVEPPQVQSGPPPELAAEPPSGE